MLSAMFTGMHCHTRSSQYVDRKKMKRTIRANRPGGNGFSFTGEFPEADNWTPVEALGRRRSYTHSAGNNGVADAVRQDEVEHLPIVNRYGVRLGAGLVMLSVLAAALAAFAIMAWSENTAMAKRLSTQLTRIETLDNACYEIEGEIAYRSNGVNIRQEAGRIGMKSMRSTDVVYLDLPEDAVLDPAIYGMTQDMASIAGY